MSTVTPENSTATPEPPTVGVPPLATGSTLSAAIRSTVIGRRLASETIEWIDPEKEKPDAETTVLLACTDGEVIPGYITCADGTDIEVWRREYWPEHRRDMQTRDVIAWAEWPAGPSSNAAISHAGEDSRKHS